MGFLRFNYSLITHYRSFSVKQAAATMKYLNVAEKNDAAKNIAAILARGNSTRREGFSVYNKIYEFDAQVLGEQCRMVMTSVSGHLLNYAFTPQFKNWQGCNPLVLFDAPIVKVCPDDYKNIQKTLEREIRSCQGLIIWTDCDREGENIGFEIIKVCTDIRPNLRIYRAKFSEITGASVFRALNTLGQPNKNVSDAVDVRQELDLRTGAAFTRLQTLRLQKVFPQKLADKLISYGSCQFPTLGFVVERYKAIEEFQSEPFWRIKMNHTVKDVTTEFSWKRERLFDKDACEAILDHCKESPQATVESVDSKSKSKWRPLPLDTVEMEKTVSRKLKITAKDTMKIAEKLYTQGYISYPRTETNIFPKELNLANLVEQQRVDRRWGAFAERIINEGGPNPRQGKKSDQAHPPIHPTKHADSLTGNDQRVYEYIVRHFLACVHKDAQGFETVVNADIAGEKFTAKGLIILEKNYLEVYVYEKWNAKEINNYQQGDTFLPTILDMVESATSAPKLLTEADLIALMEKHGIGTDATHADHIDTIKQREYVGLHDNIYFVPGTLGMGLVEGYNNIGLEISLAKPTLRAEFENDLKLICEGRKDAETVRREQVAKYREVFRTVAEKMRLIDESLSNRLDDRPQQLPDDVLAGNQDTFRPAMKCPKCGGDMIIRNRKNGIGKFISCVSYPQCKNAIWLQNCVENIDVLDDSCPQCGPNYKMLKVKFKPNPFPGDPNPNTICFGGCDMNVLDTLDISLTAVRQNNRANNSTIPITNNQVQQNNAAVNQTSNINRANSNNLSNWLNLPSSSSSTSSNINPTTTNNTNRQNTNTNNSWISNTAFGNAASSRQSLDLLPGPSGSNSGGNRLGNSSYINASTGGDNDVMCNCNQEAVQLTVKKDGPNKGKQFYACPSRTCGFFLWVGNDNNTTTNTNNDNGIRCNCNVPAVLKTVSKAGPNTGRQFYSCFKPMNEGCKFFKWADEVNEGEGGGGSDDEGGGGGGLNYSFRGGSNFGRGGRGRGKGKGANRNNARAHPYDSGNGRPNKGSRKCGRCGQPGHTKNKCPN